MFNVSLEQGYGLTTMAAVAGVAILLTAAFYYRAFRMLKPRQRQALLALRIAAIVLIVLLLPLTLSELIPLDRQYGVRELLNALPLTANLYLAGKLLSVWPLLFIGLVLAALLSGALAWLQNGPYHVGILASFWITGLLPLALFSSLVAVMLSAGQSSRRRAILTGLLAIPVGLAASFLLPVNRIFRILLFDSFSLITFIIESRSVLLQ